MVTSRVVAIRKWTDIWRINVNKIGNVGRKAENILIESFVLLPIGKDSGIKGIYGYEKLFSHGHLQINPVIPTFAPGEGEQSAWAFLHARARSGSQSHRNF